MFGALWIVAKLDIDRDRDLARVVSVKIDRTQLSEFPDRDAASLVQALESDARLWDFSIALKSLKAGLRPTSGQSGADYRNDPPNSPCQNTRLRRQVNFQILATISRAGKASAAKSAKTDPLGGKSAHKAAGGQPERAQKRPAA